MPSNHVGTFQLKTCGDVPVKVHKAANKLSKSTVIPKKLVNCTSFFFQGDSFLSDWLKQKLTKILLCSFVNERFIQQKCIASCVFFSYISSAMFTRIKSCFVTTS